MALLKFANARVIHPHVSHNQWGHIRTAGLVAKAGGDLDKNLISRASEFFKKDFSPADYLLTHATIIASVDTFEPSGMKIGSQLVDGFKVNRRFGRHRIKTASEKFINNNHDAWSREVLLRSYPTFVGGHNFVEHIQVEELSKGRIIDAVARDIGESIYVDILIATDRKHQDLIQAIENGKMGTLSMGCTVDGTQCTKCGHWAADETEMCPHIKYEKGNTFFDEQGRKQVVAELCGHESLEPHAGVYFVEASWVEQPAFTGAVLRNVIKPTDAISVQAQKILETPPPQWSSVDSFLKAAKTTVTKRVVGPAVHPPTLITADANPDESTARWQAAKTAPEVQREVSPAVHPRTLITADDNFDEFLAGWADDGSGEGGGDTPPPDAPAEPKNPLDQLEEDLEKHLLDRVVERVKDKMQKKVVDKALGPADSEMAPNDTIVKEASKKLYRAGLWTLVKKASSDVDFVNSLAEYNKKAGIDIPVAIYRVALQLGPITKYGSAESFWDACSRTLGRNPNVHEAKTILRITRMLSQVRGMIPTTGSRQGGKR